MELPTTKDKGVGEEGTTQRWGMGGLGLIQGIQQQWQSPNSKPLAGPNPAAQDHGIYAGAGPSRLHKTEAYSTPRKGSSSSLTQRRPLPFLPPKAALDILAVTYQGRGKGRIGMCSESSNSKLTPEYRVQNKQLQTTKEKLGVKTIFSHSFYTD